MRHFILTAFLFLTACVGGGPQSGDILLLGDSVMAWNGSDNADIGNVIADRLDRRVSVRAVPGAQFDNASGLASAVGFDIQAQYPGGAWNWVVLNGGANDLGFDDCGCGDCARVVDALIGPDAATGKIPAFLNRLRASGSRVLWMGYYTSPGTSFAGCTDDLIVLEGRIARYAEARGDTFFFDGEDVIVRENPDHFANDDTHPSREGSALLGTALADLIARAEGRSQ
ncbi:SGNH/GDSL hydrolase family protein [Sulfitobacter albidus]|uniref:SGNH/GDSL hydrolase family protein n=1 Tax=Sulfitobacter albidus TaxID=2829501 RepID=A0A975PLT1_9RHOB|nr:SGNH/GDSL hydrolase family protein [Sulfitobacter albidus]QUJ76097.1 SGNH/GDSL hydrolase family protein [Sulfitobacter albidus]